MSVVKFLGLGKKLRDGGRYGIPSSFIKSLKIPDMDVLRSYMDLYMKGVDKNTNLHIYNLKGNIDNVKFGTTGLGIDYAAVTISCPGEYLPFTFFLYETPENKLNLYIPERGNLCVGKDFIRDVGIPRLDLINECKRAAVPMSDEGTRAWHYYVYAPMIIQSMFPDRYAGIWGVSVIDLCGNNILSLGPKKIIVHYNSEIFEAVQSMAYMIEDFSHRVVLQGSKPKTAKPKPVVGGVDKELLYIHPDAKNWLSHKFGWKTKGVFTGMACDDPNISEIQAKKRLFEDCIFQFDKGTLHEDSREGDRDSAVWRCNSWDDVWFDDAVVKKIKKLYPGIQPEDIFLSDED